MIDLSTWLTTAQVCARLGISERTLDRECAAQRWQWRKRKRRGTKPERVFDPLEVAAREQKPSTELVRNGVEPMPPDTAPTAPVVAGLAEWQAWHVIGPRILDALVAQRPPALFVSLAEAAGITGLAVPYLKRMVKAGTLRSNCGGPHGAIRVRRADLALLGIPSPTVRSTVS